MAREEGQRTPRWEEGKKGQGGKIDEQMLIRSNQDGKEDKSLLRQPETNARKSRTMTLSHCCGI